MQDEVIAVSEVVKAPRGRKPVIDQALADTLGKVKAGQAVTLGGTFGQVEKDRRATVGQVIRKHWAHARTDKCSINWTPEGVAQVSVKASKS